MNKMIDKEKNKWYYSNMNYCSYVTMNGGKTTSIGTAEAGAASGR